ncbi:MAG: hypothetical protein ACLTE2_06865 [Eubacteriales bacterium]
MKFSQMEYQRPDVDGMIEQYKQITERFPNCKNAKEQMKCILEHESIMKAYQTMSTLAYIHNNINTADKFICTGKGVLQRKISCDTGI